MNTPVAFIVFNRPECTGRVFHQIRRARPVKLYIIADGPRPHVPTDIESCKEVMAIIKRSIDWPCDVEYNCADQNLGCARRVASGLDWAFSRSERLIVLEDDCLPNDSFFPFCEELLERYAENTEIGQICGCPRYMSRVDTPFSYIFSRYGPIWGWASWRRAWSFYDLTMSSWPAVKRSGVLRRVTESKAEFDLRVTIYDKLSTCAPSTWDYQWGYAKMVNGLLSVVPSVNMITNIGFDGNGTHPTSESFNLRANGISLPLRHPTCLARDEKFDRRYSRHFTGGNAFIVKFKRAVREMIKKMKQ